MEIHARFTDAILMAFKIAGDKVQTAGPEIGFAFDHVRSIGTSDSSGGISVGSNGNGILTATDGFEIKRGYP